METTSSLKVSFFDFKSKVQRFTIDGVRYLKRLTFILRDGRIERVYYPVPAPAAHAREVCAWLGMTDPMH